MKDSSTKPGLRAVILLIAAQCACVGIGLWSHHKVTATAARWQAEQAGQAVDAAMMQQSMGYAAGITFVWIVALQGAAGYLVLSHVQNRHSRDRLEIDEVVHQRTQDLIWTRDAVVFGLAKLAESRDPDTGHHLERIAHYATRVALALQRTSGDKHELTDEFIQIIGISSALHDIGKVGVEDSILLKPGALTNEQRMAMQKHTVMGSDCLGEIARRLGRSNFLEIAREICLHHHERWDGTGYPHGLSAESIPLSARIVALADAYDALSVRRVYKEAFPHQLCVEMIQEESGRQFDPDVVAAFMSVEGEFREIAARFADNRATASTARETADSLTTLPSDEPAHAGATV